MLVTAAMRIEVSDPDLLDDLVDFLCAMGYVARHEGERTVRAFLPLASGGSHQRRDVGLLLSTWSARRNAAALIV